MTAAVGLDIDGVVADFPRYVAESLGLDREQWTDWDLAKCYSQEVDDKVHYLCNMPATWVSLEPMPDAKQAIGILVQKKIVPVFITAVPDRFQLLRRWWLDTHFHRALMGQGLYLYSQHGESKPQLALELGLTHFVEDKPSTAKAMADAGLTSILVPTTYHGTTPDGVTAQSLLDFAREVQ